MNVRGFVGGTRKERFSAHETGCGRRDLARTDYGRTIKARRALIVGGALRRRGPIPSFVLLYPFF